MFENMKMKLTILTVIAIMVGAFIQPAAAGYYMSSNKLLSLCKSDLVADQNVCVGYVLGIADAAQTLDVEASMRRFCLPKNVTSNQLEKTAVKYMDDNPQQLDKPASYNLLVSLRTAFPCK